MGGIGCMMGGGEGQCCIWGDNKAVLFRFAEECVWLGISGNYSDAFGAS